MEHALERGPRYRVSLGSGRHPLIISDGRGIVHEDTTSVAAEGENPVRLPPRNQVITRNEHDGHASGIEGAHENRFGDGSQVARNRERAGLAAELAHAEARGIILADTKFEFGLTGDGVMLIDEAMTPDSSRYWPKDRYRPGGPQPSFDKQYVRDYLEQIKWNKQPPVPSLPDEVVLRTRDKYLEAFTRLTGKEVR